MSTSMESTSPPLTWRSLFTITPIIFTLICSICGFVIAFYYESRIGEMLVKSHSVEDYFRITLSARNIEAVLKSTFVSLVVGIVLVCLYHFIGTVVVGYIEQKSTKGTVKLFLQKDFTIFEEHRILKASALYFLSTILIVYVILSDEMKIKFARVESGLSTILSVKTKDSGTLNCLAHIKEINGFTYFYSHKESEIISLATGQILNITKDPLFKNIPIEVTPYDTLSSGTKVWSHSLSSEDFEINDLNFDALNARLMKSMEEIDEVESEQEITDAETLAFELGRATGELEELISAFNRESQRALSRDTTENIIKPLSSELSTVVMTACRLQNESDKNLQ